MSSGVAVRGRCGSDARPRVCCWCGAHAIAAGGGRGAAQPCQDKPGTRSGGARRAGQRPRLRRDRQVRHASGA
eukprot:9641272-Lingulodinium_polyedra.AAC.1